MIHPPGQPMSTLRRRLFLDHPATVGESYLDHMRFAFGFALWLGLAALAALVHALIPALFERTAGRIVTRLQGRLTSRAGQIEVNQ